MSRSRTRVGSTSSASGTTAEEPTVVIVDDHTLISSSLALSLRQSGFTQVRTMAPHDITRAALAAPGQLGAGCIVLVGLLEGDGRSTLPLIERLVGTRCRVVVVTSQRDASLLGECLRRGVETIVDYAVSIERLVEMLRRLVSGEAALTDDERAGLLEAADRQEDAEMALRRLFNALTEREADVLANLVAGAAPKQIAHAKGISLFTVRNHIQRVLSKLDVSSQREALAMARDAGWPQFRY